LAAAEDSNLFFKAYLQLALREYKMKKYQYLGLIGVMLPFVASVLYPSGALADSRIAACYSKSRGLVNIIKNGLDPSENLNTPALTARCKKLSGTLVIWAKEGVIGTIGPIGPQGPVGPAGPGEPDCLNPTKGDNLVGCDLTLPTVNLTLAKNDLRGIKATGATLTNLVLSGYDFTGSDFITANLTNANFQNADFRFANLSDASIDGANFSNANLCGARLPQDCPNGPDSCAIVGSVIMTLQTICPDNSVPLGSPGLPILCSGLQLSPAVNCPLL
jgi:uncharacterized protein YjbI with pentapeptide repeats